MTIIKWLEDWYKSQCDGYWEHANGILIQSADNPGWAIKIDLVGTVLENTVTEYQLFENSENDWYGFSIKNNIFEAVGDMKKLEFLLAKFKQLIQDKMIGEPE